jgi:hypothetical protein
MISEVQMSLNPVVFNQTPEKTITANITQFIFIPDPSALSTVDYTSGL